MLIIRKNGFFAQYLYTVNSIKFYVVRLPMKVNKLMLRQECMIY